MTTTKRTLARRASAAADGVTLLELLLVMAILGIVLGAGVGMFATLDVGKRQALGLVKNVLRSAQNAAIARQAPARVRIDAARGALIAESMEIVGTWHFERRAVAGAGGLDGSVSGGTLFVEDGFVGDALYFDGRLGSTAEIPIQLDPAFDFTNGFSIECALRRDGDGGGQVITAADVAGIDVTNEGRVRGWFIPRVVEDGQEKAGGRVLVESPAGLAISGRWIRVKLEYDRASLVLYVDGVPRASFAEKSEVFRVERPLHVSGKRFPFRGAVDSLVIACVVASEEIALPDTVHFAGGSPREVSFAAGGGLDRARHPDPVILTLEFDDGSERMLFVGAYGTVDG